MNAFRFVVACLCWCVVARGESLVIATYNIENYNATDRMTPDGFKKDYPKPEAEKTALRRVIHVLHADILVLQEVGPRPYLDELQRDLAKQGDDYPNAFLVEGPDPDRHVALLAKRPWKSVMPHPDVEFSYFHEHEKAKRGVLEVTFATAGGDVTLWAVHLKSRFTERDDDPISARWRAGEATAIRQLILKEFPRPASDQFIILGDFNDSKESKPLQYLSRRGEMEIASVLPATDSHGEVWTEFYAKEELYSGLDHVLVSPGLIGAVREGRARIFDAPQAAAASDHRPVAVTLDLPPTAKNETDR
ncbi:MAG TPA: endonuclease/exonuclease/phosphatase family protein [Opitutaceae bacterium]|jgi:endonuclease/exonuclease/phosphatase family metal-dependent hydrolase|nr:endonuclease/exonuclease/phosphatase family protein [Opitutaceae bacterium]